MKRILSVLISMLLFGTCAFAEEEIQADSAPAPQKQVDLYIYGEGVALSEFPIIENGTLFLPVREYLANLGAYDFSVDEDEQITVTYGDKIAAMHIGSTAAMRNGETAELAAAPFMIGETVYAPMRFVSESLGFTVEAKDDGKILSVYADLPHEVNAAQSAEEYVNSARLTSKTPYLIWVSKSKYTVYTFLRENGRWNLVYSCPCAIGASSSPTVTGTFKYFSYETRWTYEKFYVGPIMRFYGGYAIHSTLLNYDGTDYNATVGKKLSHGCVRVRPADINWLVSYVPLQTTIHVTEY